jgi:hypothetical protein
MNPKASLTVLSPAGIAAEVEKIVASRTFNRAPQLCALLKFLGARYGGEAEAAKEYEIATVVLERPDSFDPVADSIVRVQINRLRHKLRQYYAEEYPDRLVEIQISRGAYTLEVFAVAPASEPLVDLPQAPPDPAPAMAVPKTSPNWRIPSAGLFAVTVVLFAAWTRTGTTGATPGIRLHPLTAKGTLAGPAKFSPDGKTIYFGLQTSEDAGMQLRSTPADSPGERGPLPLLGYPGFRIYSVSKSGLLLLDSGKTHELRVAPLAGGPSEPVEHNVLAARWGPGGESMFVARTHGDESTLEYPPGKVLNRASNRLGIPFLHANISRSGRWIAFGRPSATETDDQDLMAVDTRDGSLRTLVRNWIDFGPPAWAPDRDEILIGGCVRGEQPGIHLVRMDGERRELWRGTNLTVVDDVRDDGSLLVREIVKQHRLIGEFPGRKGLAELTPAGPEFVAMAITADGGTLALGLKRSLDRRDNLIYLWRTGKQAEPEPLGSGIQPVFSPSGKSLLFIRESAGANRIILTDLETRVEADLTRTGYRYFRPRWAPDGESFIFCDQPDDVSQHRFFRQDLKTGQVTPVPAKARFTPLEVGSTGLFALARDRKVLSWNPANGAETDLVKFGDGPFELANASGGVSTAQVATMDVDHRDTRTVTVLELDVRTGARKVVRTLSPGLGHTFYFPWHIGSSDGKYYAFNVVREMRTLYLMSGLKWGAQ